jgi:hypothetical protein
MIAVRALRYGTRRLRAGQEFSPTRGEATLFRAVGLAKDAPTQRLVTRSAPPAPSPAVDTELAPLRAEFERLTGRKPHHLWRSARLQSEIDAAKAAAVEATLSEEPDAE